MQRGQTCSRRGRSSPLPADRPATGKTPARTAVVDLPGDDLILCQITSQTHHDSNSILLESNDFESGQLNVRSYVRPNRLFTVEQSVILYAAARLKQTKLDETLSKLRQLFS